MGIREKFKRKSPKPKESNRRPLTKKEKIMATGLVVAVVLYLLYNFVYLPQTEEIAKLEIIKEDKQAEVTNINRVLSEEDTINEKIEEITKAKEKATEKYYANIYQPDIIKTISGLMQVDGYLLEEVRFNDSETEKIDKETPIYSLGIVARYSSTYDSLIKVIDNINSHFKHIGINGMTVSKGKESNILEGEFILQILSTTGLVETVNEQGEKGDQDETEFDGGFPFADPETGIFEDGKIYDESGNIIGDTGEDTGETGSETVTGEAGKESIDLGSGKEETIVEPEEDTRVITLLNNFEDNTTKFYSTSSLSRGRVSRSTDSKLGTYSMKLDYNIIAVDKINRVYADMSDKEIILKYPPQTLGMWVKAYGYSPATLGLRLTGQAGEIVELEVSKGIGFVGWEHIELVPPQDVSIYPLKVEKYFIEMPADREDFGVILIDQLESIMPGTTVGKAQGEIKSYEFYITQPNDTLKKIVTERYGNINNIKDIGKLNDITDYDVKLAEGVVMIMPKY